MSKFYVGANIVIAEAVVKEVILSKVTDDGEVEAVTQASLIDLGHVVPYTES